MDTSHIKNTKKIIVRKKSLEESLKKEKINYFKYGVLDSYLKYGYPNLPEAINYIKTNEKKRKERQRKISRKLKKYNQDYDSEISYFKNYVNNGGDIDYSIEQGMNEIFLIEKTKYLKYLEKYRDEDIAEEQAKKEFNKTNILVVNKNNNENHKLHA
jgi:hypothetical protein